jgi:GNAT superfamily N-acetyltransferase
MGKTGPITVDWLKNHPGEIPKLAKLWHTVLKDWRFEVPLNSVEDHFQNFLNTEGLPITVGAFQGGNSVGMDTLRNPEATTDPSLDLAPWLSYLVVDPVYRKLGVGRLLIDAIKENASDMGFLNLSLWTQQKTDLPKLYTDLGGSTIDHQIFLERPIVIMKIGLQ